MVIEDQIMIRARNPWLKVGMAKKPYYVRKPQPWVLDKSKLSLGQRTVNDAFTRKVYESIKNFPADGTLATLKNRVEWIGAQMRSIKGYDTIDKLKVKVPLSAKESHPAVAELAKRYGVSATDVISRLKKVAKHPELVTA